MISIGKDYQVILEAGVPVKDQCKMEGRKQFANFLVVLFCLASENAFEGIFYFSHYFVARFHVLLR